MDRGIDGLIRTVNVLDHVGLSHDGSYKTCEQEKHPFVANVKDTRIAIIPFTYGTNFNSHRKKLPNDEYVNLLNADTALKYPPKKKNGLRRKIMKLLRKPFKIERIVALKKMLGMTYNVPRQDNYLDEKSVKPYFQKLKSIMDEAKQKADLILFYPHIGGQFNVQPGRFTEYTVSKALEYGADAIVASHPHIVQKAEYKENKPCFYSIGNFSMSPNSVYLLHENLPEYGLAAHLYIENKEIVKTTFSILKIVEKKNEMLTVFPLDLLFDELSNQEDKEKLLTEARRIYSAVTGVQPSEPIIRREYELC